MKEVRPKKGIADFSPIKLKEKVEFNFAIKSNADAVALALSFAGYYVRCSTSSSGYLVRVYTDRI